MKLAIGSRLVILLLFLFSHGAARSENMQQHYGGSWNCNRITMDSAESDSLYRACRKCEVQELEFFRDSASSGHCVAKNDEALDEAPRSKKVERPASPSPGVNRASPPSVQPQSKSVVEDFIEDALRRKPLHEALVDPVQDSDRSTTPKRRELFRGPTHDIKLSSKAEAHNYYGVATDRVSGICKNWKIYFDDSKYIGQCVYTAIGHIDNTRPLNPDMVPFELRMWWLGHDQVSFEAEGCDASFEAHGAIGGAKIEARTVAMQAAERFSNTNPDFVFRQDEEEYYCALLRQ
jgi:hypothetical protein